MANTPTRSDFLRALHPTGGYHYLACFKPETDTHLTSNPDDVEEFCARHGGLDVYCGVAERDEGGRDLEHCTTLHCLFTEVDFKDTPEEQARSTLDSFPVRPSIVVSSGGGLHVYWLLREPLPLAEAGAAQAREFLRALAHRLGGDMRAAEPARVLRLPWTLNTKYQPHREVQVEWWEPEWRVALLDLLAHCPPPEASAQRQERAEPLPDIAGEGTRNDVLFREGCRLRRLGFSESEIRAALVEVNRNRCKPPLPDSEVVIIARSASRYKPAADTFPMTETGDSEFFAACFSDLVRYDHRRSRWLLFNCTRWAPQSSGEVDRLALEAVRGRQRAAEGSKERLKWSAGGESRSRRTNLVALAQSVEQLADSGANWDLDPWTLCVPNGIIDLRTGELRPGRPEDRITMQAPHPYDPNARAPLWESTLEEIFAGEPDKLSYVQRALGYSCTGDCREEVFFLLTGELDSPDKSGRNGKGTVINTVAAVLGDYHDNLAFHSLERSEHGAKTQTNDLAKLCGRRFVTASEATGGRFDEARIKSLTGRDPITARFLYSEEFTFVPGFKLWLSVNSPPKVRDESVGFWSRPHVIVFPHSFAGREDKGLKDKLLAEGPGILAWLVRGAVEWYQRGLAPPVGVQAAVDKYKEQEDRLAMFYDDPGVVISKDARVLSSSLHAWYVEWSRRTKHFAVLGPKKFSQAVARRFGAAKFGSVNKVAGMVFSGIGLGEDAARIVRNREEIEL